MSERHEILRFLAALNNPDDVIELRVLDHCPSGSRWSNTLSGYFSDREKLVEAALRASPRSKGVYVIMNEIDPALLARRANEAAEVPKGEPVTGDSEVLRRRFILLDFDPKRPTGIASADHEHEAALKIARDVRAALAAEGWPASALVDTGNGAAVYYAVDLPADDGGLVERTLKGLALRFGTKEVELDTSVHNPARLCRLPGTLNRKGSNTKDRPHRWCRILELPEHLPPVSESLLEAVATKPPDPGGRTAGPQRGSFDIDSWIRERGLEVEGPEPWNGGRRWVFRTCPFNSTHTNGSAFILQLSSGAVAAGCHHNGCTGKDWSVLRDTVEPGWRNEGRRREWNGAGGHAGAKPAGDSETTKDRSAPYRPFPADALPGLAYEGVKRKLKALGLDSAYIGVPLLASYAGVIGNTRSIHVPGWTELACLRTGVVAKPGGAKSPAWKYAIEPLLEIQRRAFRDFKKLKAEHTAAMHKHKVKFGNWEKAARKNPVPDSPPEEPDEPAPRRCLVSDTTAQKLVCIHEKNPRGLLLAREELGGFLGSLDAHQRGESDAAFWNESYDGGGSIVDRKSDGTHFTARACVSVSGTIQPKALSRLLNQSLFDCGFAQRFVFVMPPDPPARELATEEDESSAHPLAVLFEGLHALQPALARSPDGEEEEFEPIELRLTDKARLEFAAWYKKHELQRIQLSGALREFHAKNAGRALRLILVVYVVREVAQGRAATAPVSVQAVRDGLRLADWFAYEARRVYSMLGQLDEKAEGAEDLALLAWIRGWIAGGRDAPTARDTQRNHTPLKTGTVEEAEKALRRLSRLGHVYPEVDGQAERFLPFEVSDGDAYPKNPEEYEEASPSLNSNGGNRCQEPHPRKPGEDAPAASGAARTRGGKKARV